MSIDSRVRRAEEIAASRHPDAAPARATLEDGPGDVALEPYRVELENPDETKGRHQRWTAEGRRWR